MDMPWQLKKLRRWCFTGTEHDGGMAKAPFAYVDGKFVPISVTSDHNKLVSYEELLPLLQQHPERGFGFVLTQGDGFTVADIDIGDDTPVEATEQWWKAVESYQTYTEASRSGGGYHLWFGGEIDGSYKRGGLELYSKERFIICTGNVILGYGIRFDQGLIDQFNQYISNSRKVDNIADIDEPEKLNDTDLLHEVYAYDHSGKFECLMTGDWDKYLEIMKQQGAHGVDVFDASRADSAFMTIVTYYTRNIEQCKRLWRMSALANLELRYPGNRKKQHEKRNHVGSDRLLHLAIKQAATENMKDEELRKAHAEEGAKLAKELHAKRNTNANTGAAEPKYQMPPLQGKLNYPPGWMGELARHFYSTGVKQIKEFAIAEALSLASGLFGRAYNISGTGLNNYFMVLAPSGTGKSQLTAAPQEFMRLLEREQGVIDASKFVVTEAFTHRNAMMKVFQENTSFLHALSEFGNHFRAMVNPDGSTRTVRDLMVETYSKSGAYDVLGGVRYTDMEKTVNINHAVAYSFLGECVPETFYDCLNEEAFGDGFVSRFIFSEFSGEVPYDNIDRGVRPSPALVDHMTQAVLCMSAALRDPNHVDVMPIALPPDIAEKFRALSRYCTDMVNQQNTSHAWNATWTRTNLKVMKVSALLAVMDNPTMPKVTEVHMNWAWDYVLRHNYLVWDAVQSGKVTMDGTTQRRAELIANVMRKFVEQPYMDITASVQRVYKQDLHRDGLVSRAAIVRSVGRSKLFADTGGRGVEDHINAALRHLEAMDVIRSFTKKEMRDKYQARCEAYLYLGE